MTKTFSFAVACLFGLVVYGCDSKTNDTSAANDSGSTLKPVSTESANNAPKQNPGIDLSKVPADLKGDAYEYYGLGRTEPIKMTVVRGSDKQDASQTVKLTKVEKDYAEFTITSDGALSELGEVIVRLDKGGIRVMSVKGKAADPDTFELPNGLTKGKSWPFKLPGEDPKISGTNKVGGTEKVKTAVGTYENALLVITTASGVQAGQKTQLQSKQWLVKGRGQVKAEITNVSGKTKQTVTMEESK